MVFSVPRALVIVLFLMAFTGVAAEAQESAPPSAAAPADLKPGLSVEQFKAALPATNDELGLQAFLDLKKAGPVTVLDLRTKDNFDRRHLKGSVNLPLTELTEKTLPAAAPDKSAPVVLACDYSFAPTRMISGTMQAYPVLNASGYTRIYRLNLWMAKPGEAEAGRAALEKTLEFEGSDVKP